MSIVNKVLRHYTKIPLWATNIAAPFYYLLPESLRYGAVYNREKAALAQIDRLTESELKAKQCDALCRLIDYSYEHVTYYRDLFRSRDLSPSDIRTVSDLNKLPFLTKELLVKNRDRLISDEFSPKDLQYITTSGSTGEPTGFYVQKDSAMREWVYGLHAFRDFGYKPTSSKLVMRGKVFWAQREKGLNWQWDAFKRELSINIFNMTPENMEQYCRVIEKYKPDFAFGYISAMYTLCKFIRSRPNGLKHHFQGYMSISETVLPEQREFIQKVISAPVFSFYGMSERVIYAAERPGTTEYLVEPMYGIAELVDASGKLITRSGVEGELVGTSLLNYAMPLIRYKTGDLSCWSGCEGCGYGTDKARLAYVSGRWKHDMLVNKDGALLSMTAINMHSEVFEKIQRYQLYQDTIGFVTIRVVVSETFNDYDERELITEFNEKAQEKITFSIVKMPVIPTNANGKFQLVDQRLDVSKYL